MKRPLYLLAGLAAATAVVASSACGGGSPSSTPVPSQPQNTSEVSPPGDIPDNQAFVEYAPPDAAFAVEVPEGWARTTDGATTVFTDKLNAIRIEAAPAPAAPTVQSATSDVVPALSSGTAGFQLGQVSAVTRNAGGAVLITYQADSPADPVTGKTVIDDVERYLFFHNGTLVTLTLSGPKGADNVDPWRIVTDSLRWTA